MKAEFYVCQMIRYNKYFRVRVARLIGIPDYTENDASYILSVLRSDAELNDIAKRLNCSVAEVFLEIRRQIQNMAVQQGLGARGLKKYDLLLFHDQKFLNYISSQLKCGNTWSEIVFEIFDAQAMMDLSLACGILDPSEEVNLAQLFWRLTNNDGIRKITNLGITDIWSAVDAVIEEKARDKLSKCFSCRGEQVLGYLVSNFRKEPYEKEFKIDWNDGTEPLDFFAIETMRRRFWAISDRFLVQAEGVAEKLRKHVDHSHPASWLSMLLQYYGARFYRKALEQFIEPEQKVGSLCDGLQILTKYNPTRHVDILCDYETDENHQNYVMVRAKIPETAEIIDVSKLSVANKETAQHLIKYIPSNSDELNQNGETFAQRIQSTFIKRLPNPYIKAWSLMKRIKINELVQFFVLSGRELPDVYGLRNILSPIYKSGKISLSRSKTICKKPNDICKMVIENYEKDNKKYKLV